MNRYITRILNLTLIIISTCGPMHAQETGDQLSPGMVNPGYVEKPAWFKDSFLDIRDDVNDASESGKRVLLYFYQDGCPYCERLLKENMSQQNIVDSLRKDFDVIAINMWGDREVVGLDGNETTEKNFSVANKIMFTPTLQFLDEEGRHILRLNGYVPPHKFKVALDYVSLKKEKDGSFRDFMAANCIVKLPICNRLMILQSVSPADPCWYFLSRKTVHPVMNYIMMFWHSPDRKV